MLDPVLVANPTKDVIEGVFVVRHIGELDAVIGQHGVDCIGHGSNIKTFIATIAAFVKRWLQ